MVPSGIRSARGLRVSYAIVGARDAHVPLPALVMDGVVLWRDLHVLLWACLFLFARPIARIYTPEIEVIKAGATLLSVAACFSYLTGLQVVATGALRGAGNTRIPMLANLVGYWVMAASGAFLLFPAEDGRGGNVAGTMSGACPDRQHIALVGILMNPA